MGQYHLTVNLDKREFLDPHKLGDGLKLWEQLNSQGGTMAALHILLACSNGRGGGDLEEHPMIGRWAGDRIAVVGDYAEDGDLAPEHRAGSIYDLCRKGQGEEDSVEGEPYRDITDEVVPLVEAGCGVKITGKGWREKKGATVGLRPDMAVSRKAKQPRQKG